MVAADSGAVAAGSAQQAEGSRPRAPSAAVALATAAIAWARNCPLATFAGVALVAAVRFQGEGARAGSDAGSDGADGAEAAAVNGGPRDPEGEEAHGPGAAEPAAGAGAEGDKAANGAGAAAAASDNGGRDCGDAAEEGGGCRVGGGAAAVGADTDGAVIDGAAIAATSATDTVAAAAASGGGDDGGCGDAAKESGGDGGGDGVAAVGGINGGGGDKMTGTGPAEACIAEEGGLPRPLRAPARAAASAAGGDADITEDVLRYYSVDVECVASGVRHDDRVVAQVSLVRGDGEVLLDLHVKPSVPVVSYITPLTGLTRELLEERGLALEEALRVLRSHLPPAAVLVGQGIDNDVRWLGLVKGQDFSNSLDLASLWRVWNTTYGSWSVFSQEHLCKVLLAEDPAGRCHNAVDDAVKAVQLFRLHRRLAAMGETVVEDAKLRLLATPVSPPFKRRHPVFEGVCMGDRKSCRCGAPFYCF